MKVACILFQKPSPTSKFAEILLRFSPQISLCHDRAIFVEIGRSKNLYSEQSFIARTNVLLRKHGFSARIAIGQDVTDSLTFTKFGKNSIEELPLEALHDFADPFLRDETLRKSVQNLIDSFRDLGITKLGQFKNLPVGELVSRFGVFGRFIHQRVRLQDFINWPLWTPEEIIVEKKEILNPEFNGSLEPIIFELKGHLDSIFARLRSRQRRVTKLQVQIKCEKLSVHPEYLRSFNFEFFAPQTNVKSTIKILMERLSREFERKPIHSAVEWIETTVVKSVPFEGSQKNLLNNEEEKFEALNSVHNQLVELLGKENVFQIKLTEDRRPERAWVKYYGTPHNDTDEENLSAMLPERSTYLCRFPLKIEVTAGFVHIKKKRYKILHWDNEIEKLSGGWFENPKEDINDTFDRTYSQVTLEGFQRISVFETKSREFYLHGYFG